ncbi:MAG: DEAD/DEAH box helicase family protein, partial [Deltaproteobacteria bacterium]|nr:DEAD/DEAH box helicase family protein [Deltaproteobacteria bacterium]
MGDDSTIRRIGGPALPPEPDPDSTPAEVPAIPDPAAQGAYESLTRTDRASALARAAALHRPGPSTWRPYQTRMIESVVRDAAAGDFSWLALASPMQTGKSFITRLIIERLRELWGEDTLFIFLSASRIITSQTLKDLGNFPADQVGRFDAEAKEIRPITVAGFRTLAPNLDQFPRNRRVVLINDEAFFTQSPSFQKIYCYFGLGETSREDGRVLMSPKRGQGLVIGYSGTGSGLAGYHLSGQLDLLTAMQDGWVRNIIAEQIPFQTETVRASGAWDGSMIWWKPTPENADALVKAFYERVEGRQDKALHFVPTIEHAELYMQALARYFGDDYGHLLHSGLGLDADEIDDVVEEWHGESGGLVTIGMFSRGARGTGVIDVYHTYQSGSMELFAQRTGRAWGVEEGAENPDLHVYEATWSRRGFMNMARLLGLADFPTGNRLVTRGLGDAVRHSKKIQETEKEKTGLIASGKLDPLFTKVPLVEKWRTVFRAIVDQAGGVNSLSEKVGLASEFVVGLALGALPLRLNHLLQLGKELGGEDKAAALWVESWSDALREMARGERTTELETGEFAWMDSAKPLEERALLLDKFLTEKFSFQPQPWENHLKEIYEALRYQPLFRELSYLGYHDDYFGEWAESFVKTLKEREQ